MKRILGLLGAALVLGGCSDATAPEEGRDEASLTFVSTQGVPLEADQASFWAVQGQTRGLVLRRADGTTALEFEVGPNTLVARPDGSPFAANDSVLISVEADSQGRYIFDFQPSGLRFSALQPALIRVHYDPDLNGDGIVNLVDGLLSGSLLIWIQAAPGLPWLPLPSLRLPGQPVVEGRVTHFTGFALAS